MSIDPKERKKIEDEQEAWRTVNAMFEDKEKAFQRALEEKDKILGEQNKSLNEKDKILDEKNKSLNEKDKLIEELKRRLGEIE